MNQPGWISEQATKTSDRLSVRGSMTTEGLDLPKKMQVSPDLAKQIVTELVEKARGM